MNISIRIRAETLCGMRTDLDRPHDHAWERVGFMIAAITASPKDLLLLVRDYQPVADDDYVRSTSVGAEIGSEAFRKALQSAYRPKSALIHVHAHHGTGIPQFSETDLKSGSEFVPSFFTTVPRMPQGMIVLSDNSAAGLLWMDEQDEPQAIDHFCQIGRNYRRDWARL